MKIIATFCVSAIAAIVIASPALADRHPNAEERKQIETVLTNAGYASWGAIELDDDRVWEVDDARHSDGHRYDLDLDTKTLKIIKKDHD